VVLKVAVPEELVRRDVDQGYGPVADAFRRNFAERDDIGAACAVSRGTQGRGPVGRSRYGTRCIGADGHRRCGQGQTDEPLEDRIVYLERVQQE
jgi:hypothetical protein